MRSLCWVGSRGIDHLELYLHGRLCARRPAAGQEVVVARRKVVRGLEGARRQWRRWPRVLAGSCDHLHQARCRLLERDRACDLEAPDPPDGYVELEWALRQRLQVFAA